MHDLVMNFPVNKLVDILKKNKKEHIQIVEGAQEAYVQGLVEEFEKKLSALKEGKNVNPNTSLRLPGDHRASYTNAIAMLEMTTDETIELGSSEFAAYVRDKWHWQKDFLSTANSLGTGGHYYLSVSTSKYDNLYGED